MELNKEKMLMNLIGMLEKMPDMKDEQEPMDGKGIEVMKVKALGDDHAEPDEDQFGGESDDDADNMPMSDADSVLKKLMAKKSSKDEMRGC